MTGTNTQSRKSRRKLLIPFLAFLVLAFAGGYFAGRFSSTNWNSDGTAFTYMCRASHRLTNSPDGAVLELSLPDAVYRYDGKDVVEIPSGTNFRSTYPVLGAEEYEDWMKGIIAFGAGAAAKPVWDVIADSTAGKVVQGFTAEERAIASILTLGSFGGGFLLGHQFKADFDAPKFRQSLRDKAVWKRVWLIKQQWLGMKANLDTATANLEAARNVKSPTDPPDKSLDEHEREIRKSSRACGYNPGMTWIVGMPTMFGYSIGISDIRVTLSDGSEHDCLQKIYPVTNSIAVGFAGSVRIGFMMAEAMSRWLRCDEPDGFWQPLEVAEQWPEIAKKIFQSALPEEQGLQCALILLSTDPVTRNGPGPQTYVHTFHSPDFEPLKAETQKTAGIGSGAFIAEHRQHLDELSENHERRFNLMRMEAGMPGGMGSHLGYQLTDLLKRTTPNGISSHLHYCWVYLGKVIIKTNDHSMVGRWTILPGGSGINQPEDAPSVLETTKGEAGEVVFRMPRIARSWTELNQILNSAGAKAEGSVAAADRRGDQPRRYPWRLVGERLESSICGV
jgi:hypothetical protein